MLIELDSLSTDPPFEQLRSQVIALVLKGELQPGDRLPSIRQLAGDLGLASGTVARAYRELEADGVLRGRGARGTTVVGPPASAARTSLFEAASSYARAATDADVDLDEAVALLRIAFAAARW
ncbi:MAG: GntR family transcriptional regulator [Acidimicrobiales bacterium]